MYTVDDKLQFCEVTIRAIRADLKVIPEKMAIHDLLEACQKLDEKYKEFCASFDTDDKLEPGTTYKEGGLSIEFYIEADDWHEISEALRKICPPEVPLVIPPVKTGDPE